MHIRNIGNNSTQFELQNVISFLFFQFLLFILGIHPPFFIYEPFFSNPKTEKLTR